MASARPDIAVVLAGGASSRMGRPKALLEDARGRTFLSRLVATLRAGGCHAVIVVGGRHLEEIARALPEHVLLANNPEWQEGQLSSAQVGLRAALAFQPARVVLHVVDQPLIQPRDVRAILSALGGHDVAVACCKGETGHPIALSVEAAGRVAQARGESLRAVIDRVARRRIEVPGCSRGCVKGANTPGELKALLRTRPPRAAGQG